MTNSSDLFTAFDDSDLAEMLRHGPPELKVRLSDLLGQDRAEALLVEEIGKELSAPSPAGLSLPPDPALPEIVLLHGITDCHLANVSKRRDRIWLSLFELAKGRFSKTLSLLPDGIGDQPGFRFQTDGHVGKKYDKTLDRWTASRFRNRVYCYDWRRSVTVAADGLAESLRGLDSVKRGEKVVLVCHSMGGLVATAFAERHGDWDRIVKHCVFVGSPLGGSYSVPYTILGFAESFKKMDRLSIFERLIDFQRMAASFPGLIDMLPDPDLFPDASDFYEQVGWPGPVKPEQRHLNASRALKGVLAGSPIFEIATHLVARGIETVSSMPWDAERAYRLADRVSLEGDGAALNLSSLVPGLTAYLVEGEHGTLVNEPSVAEAVMRIAQGQPVDLPSIDRGDLFGDTQMIAVKAQPAGFSIDPAESLDRRVGSGLALHFASADAVAANLQAFEHGFQRTRLGEADFSWQNALSLGIASEEAYRSDSPEMRRHALEDWGFSEYRHFESGETQGFATWDDQVVVISFRGSEKKIADWLGNLTLVSNDTGSENYGKVHKGFYDGFKRVESAVRSCLDEANANGKVIHLTGHSLGGALAVVAGAELREGYPEARFCFHTFGQPKVGRDPLAAFYRQHFEGRYYRFRNNDDIVTRIPPNYWHFGELFWFDRVGELRGADVVGLALPGAVETAATVSELSEGEFKRLQEDLERETEPPGDPGALFLPPSDAGLESAFRVPGFSVSDHSMSGSYLPILRKHLSREQGQ